MASPAPLPRLAATEVREPARRNLMAAADQLLAGDWDLLGVRRSDMRAPDWFRDPITGYRPAPERCAFAIDAKDRAQTGNIKQLWELSRHHHLTVLAAAWSLSGKDPYADAVDRHLRSWWAENPFLSGVHWTSGIEIGIRLISWTWIRRLLDGWSGVTRLFEGNETAVRQVRWHQEYLAGFRSAGSSANNHVVAEAAGQLVAACAFPWFPESARWRRSAATLLERELQRNTFPSGINRELASDYHPFVAELGLIASVEAEAVGQPMSNATWALLCRMVDAAAALVDGHVRGPRQGDGDDGRALLLDSPGASRWSTLLSLGAGLFGPQQWWPKVPEPDVRSIYLTALAGGRRPIAGRWRHRPDHFPDAGLTILRTDPPSEPEVWCRCDGGPHGYLAIAAHAHADALSIEVRHRGVDVLADPGTYCYHDEPEWRSYFRSTLGHNTLELDGRPQSRPGGPFMWVTQATSRVLHAHVDPDQDIASWSAEHDGYLALEPPARHRRTVRLDRRRRRLEISDEVETSGSHACRLAFHLGPTVDVTLAANVASLGWPSGPGWATATLRLPPELRWTMHRGEIRPILGWYSSGFGRKEPTPTLVGTGSCPHGHLSLTTVMEFSPT